MRWTLIVTLAACAPSEAPEASSTSETTPETTPDTTPETTPQPVLCVPPAVPALADIPDDPSLGDDNDWLVVFAIDGDDIVGKHVRDAATGEGALGLWQELILRIPTNQRAQLVQFTLFGGEGDLAAWVDNVGTQNDVGRYGPSVYFHVDNLADNDPDPCAPLVPRRGTYDGSLVHEFGHLRQYADGSVDDFVEHFGNATGDGEGYPDDGSPTLDGDWVSSYAERAGGDEDAAESFTAFVMLDPLPTEASVAADKVRFFDTIPGYRELRSALRVTEPGGGGVTVPDAPLARYDLVLDPPAWLLGSWEGPGATATMHLTVSVDDVVFDVDGDLTSLGGLREGGALATVRVLESSEAFHLLQVATEDDSYSITFSLDGQLLTVEHERLGSFALVAL